MAWKGAEGAKWRGVKWLEASGRMAWQGMEGAKWGGRCEMEYRGKVRSGIVE